MVLAQQEPLQYGTPFPSALEPTHCTNTTLSAGEPSAFRTGPFLIIASGSQDVTASLWMPYLRLGVAGRRHGLRAGGRDHRVRIDGGAIVEFGLEAAVMLGQRDEPGQQVRLDAAGRSHPLGEARDRTDPGNAVREGQVRAAPQAARGLFLFDDLDRMAEVGKSAGGAQPRHTAARDRYLR